MEFTIRVPCDLSFHRLADSLGNPLVCVDRKTDARFDCHFGELLYHINIPRCWSPISLSLAMDLIEDCMGYRIIKTNHRGSTTLPLHSPLNLPCVFSRMGHTWKLAVHYLEKCKCPTCNQPPESLSDAWEWRKHEHDGLFCCSVTCLDALKEIQRKEKESWLRDRQREYGAKGELRHVRRVQQLLPKARKLILGQGNPEALLLLAKEFAREGTSQK